MRIARRNGSTWMAFTALAALSACGGAGGGGWVFPPADDGGGQVVDATTPAPDLAGPLPEPDAGRVDSPDLARLPMAGYPAGPYGNRTGDTLANQTLPGYRLTPRETDATKLPWSESIRFSDYHNDAQCKCLLVTWGAIWCTACRQEQPTLVNDINRDPSFCVLNILQEGARQGGTATRADVDAWTRAYRQNFHVVQGNAATRQLWNGHGPSIGMPFNFIVEPRSMKLKKVVHGYTPSIRAIAQQACAQ